MSDRAVMERKPRREDSWDQLHSEAVTSQEAVTLHPRLGHNVNSSSTSSSPTSLLWRLAAVTEVTLILQFLIILKGTQINC